MNKSLKTIVIILHLFTLGLFVSCEQPDENMACKCKDTNGNIVIDTVYYMEPDQAYQLCNGKEGTSTIVSCDCYELE